MYHQGFDQIAAEMQTDREKYGDKIQFATRTEIGEAAEFYQEPLDIEERIVYNRYSSISEFYQWLHEHDQASMLGFGWTDYMHPIWEATAVGFYPNVVNQKDWFTSRYLTLSKVLTEGGECSLVTLDEKPHPFYNGSEWSGSSIVCGDSLPDNVESIGFIANFHCIDTVRNCVVVIEIKDVEKDSLLLWYSSPTEEVEFAPGNNIIVNAVNFNEIEKLEGKAIKSYIWNKGHCLMTQDKMSYYLMRKDPILTGLYDPLN